MDLPTKRQRPEARDANSGGSAADLSALKDLVCGMAVTPASPHQLAHEGRPYYFCSAGCQAKFKADPAAYMAKPAKSVPAAAP